MSSPVAHGSEDPPPYFPDAKDIIGQQQQQQQQQQDEGMREEKCGNLRDLRICGRCHRTSGPSELVYYCLVCKKVNDELMKKNRKNESMRRINSEEVNVDKKRDGKEVVKREVCCQSCQARGELCPNANTGGNHELIPFTRRGCYYHPVQSREVLSSDSDVARCVKAGDAMALNALGRNAEGLNTQDETGNTPLHMAIRLGSEEMIRILVGMGAFIETRNEDGSSPLLLALDYHYPSLIGTLIDLGADPNGKGATFSPLHRAAAMGCSEMIIALLAKKPMVDSMRKGITPLFTACVLGELAAAKLLLDAGANPKLKSSVRAISHSALAQMVLMGSTEEVKLLLKYGADMSEQIRIGISWGTPLTTAAILGRTSIGLVLLDAGADIDAPDSNGRTALATAATLGKLDFVKLLLERKADMGKKSVSRWTALTDAAHMGHLEVVKILVDHGDVGDPSPFPHWRLFGFKRGVNVPKDTRKAIIELGQSAKRSANFNSKSKSKSKWSLCS